MEWLDSRDEAILAFLEKDGRASYSDIARRLRVAEGTVRKRIERLVSTGAIQRFTIETHTGVQAIVGLKADPRKPTDAITDKIRAMEGVLRAFEVTGRYDIIFLAAAQDTAMLNKLVEHTRAIPGVIESECFIVLH